MKTFKTIIGDLNEAMHPELLRIAIRAKDDKAFKIHKKWTEIENIGKKPGVVSLHEGSARLYTEHADPHDVIIDGVRTTMRTGLKVENPDSYCQREHKKQMHKFNDHSLGALQNKAETHPENDEHRVLIHKGYDVDMFGHRTPKFEYNPHGIFAPIIKSSKKHRWIHVGHVRDLNNAEGYNKPDEFQQLTKTKEFPNGITHNAFDSALHHLHKERLGEHSRPFSKAKDAIKHPMVKNFNDYHIKTKHWPDDYHMVNMGVWEHPVTGEKHIVARDHGYSLEVKAAYENI